ncbi:MAG: ferritin-like domain-containing protein [Pseudomonadota bacterium]
MLQPPSSQASSSANLPTELRQLAQLWLAESEPAAKVAGVAAMAHAWQDGALSLDCHAAIAACHNIPGRPARPQLVSPLEVKRRAMNTLEGRAILIHALAHIEFNAINLALDALWRFATMPPAYYSDWLLVAQEEAYHFSLLAAHLQTMGFSYGDFPAHNSLWDMAEKTCDDVLARIALVPRTMEARGLDASPPVRAKLAQVGEMAAAHILDIILHDEIGHVATGNRWYAWCCAQRELEPVATYAALAFEYAAPQMRPPFNLAARRLAGFTEPELAALLGITST